MVGAYGWAFMNPLRKLYYNLTITGISVIVAVVIGGIETAGLVAEKLDASRGIWAVATIARDHFDVLGFIVIGVLLLSWLVSAMIYRHRVT
jgi:nickel/cobalt transporter (NiCoT) family protein